MDQPETDKVTKGPPPGKPESEVENRAVPVLRGSSAAHVLPEDASSSTHGSLTAPADLNKQHDQRHAAPRPILNQVPLESSETARQSATGPESDEVIEVAVDAPSEPPIAVRTSSDGQPQAPETDELVGSLLPKEKGTSGNDPELSSAGGSSSFVQREELWDNPTRAAASEVLQTKGEMMALKGDSAKGTEVDGLEDTELWALQRRFDENINHVCLTSLSTEPDLRPSKNPSPFRSDAVKSNFERVAAALGPPSLRGVRELRRLADWENERTRTALYCSAYFTAWFFGYAVIVVGGFLAVVVCFPDTRRYLFPEASPQPRRPLSATDPTNTRGDESLLSTGGNVHRTRAEQAEEQAFEARALTEAYAQVLLLGSKGKGTQETDGPSPAEGAVVDDTGKVVGWRGDAAGSSGSNADATVGGEPVKAKRGHSDKHVEKLAAKQKRDEMVTAMAKKTELALGMVADYLEILQHAMSPPKPYPDHHARFKIASALIIPPVLAIHFVPAWLWGRAATLCLGAGLWGWPLGKLLIAWIGPKFDWSYILDPRNSLLANTPTNAQLLLHILRVSEALGMPLPPPPPPPVADSAKQALAEQSPIGGPGVNAPEVKEEDNAAEKAAKKATAKSKHHITNAFRKLSRKLAGVRGDVAVDGKQKPLTKLNNMLVERKFGEHSPDAYACKLGKSAGNILVDAEGGRLAFVTAGDSAVDPGKLWNINDIRELEKDGVSLPRMALSWLGGAVVESLGLRIWIAGVDNPLELRGVRRRDPLFNRLIAIGSQNWEVL